MGDRNEVKSIIRSILISSAKPLTLRDLENDYLDMTGTPIPYSMFSKNSTFEVVNMLRDVVRIDNSGPRSLLRPVTTESTAHITELVSAQKSKDQRNNRRPVSRFVQKQRHSHNRKHNVQPPQRDNRETATWNQDLREQEIVRTKVSEMNLVDKQVGDERKDDQKPDQITDVRTSKPKFIPYLMLRAKKVQAEKQNSSTRTISETITDKKATNNHPTIPSKPSSSSSVINARRIPWQYTSLTFKELEFVRLQIMEIYSPHAFWFILHKNLKNLKEQQRAMKAFYSSQNHLINSFIPSAGDACAILLNKKWYRGEVVFGEENGKVTVFLIDFGSVAKVKIGHSINALHEKFINLPRQALRGRLANVETKCWTLNDVKHFAKLVDGKSVFGRAENSDTVTRVHCLTLIDTSQDEDKNVLEQMVHAGIVCTTTSSEAGNEPSFDMVESGRCKWITADCNN